MPKGVYIRTEETIKHNPWYKDGRSFEKKYCLDCKKEISSAGAIRCNSCSQKEIWKNNYNLKLKGLIKGYKNRNRYKQNNLEKRLESILNNLLPNEYQYTGDGKVILQGFIPDFVNNKQKKIIELFGVNWHRNTTVRDAIRKIVYDTYKFKTLIIWSNEFKDINKLYNKIMEFNNA